MIRLLSEWKKITAVACALLLMSATTSAMGDVKTRQFVSLKSNIVVEGEKIRLDDVFDVFGPSAEVTVADAPGFGRTVLLDTISLAGLVSNQGLVWNASNVPRHIEIRRASQTLSTVDIIALIGKEIQSQSAGQEFEILILQGDLQLNGPTGNNAPPIVEILEHNGNSERFRARVSVVDGESAIVSGTARQIMQVPVLERAFQRGEVVTDADLNWIAVRINSISRHVVTDARELVGRAARRPLRSGQPIMASDIEKPIVISKGVLVTMTYDVPGMILTDTGRAMTNGAIGDTINVLNPRSHRTVMATVVSSNLVRLAPSAPLIPALHAGLVQ